jgi:hypothetical protein
MKANIGDWVRFYQNGVMVIGVIQYITKDILGKQKYNTDIGEVSEDYIFEVRKAS